MTPHSKRKACHTKWCIHFGSIDHVMFALSKWNKVNKVGTKHNPPSTAQNELIVWQPLELGCYILNMVKASKLACMHRIRA